MHMIMYLVTPLLKTFLQEIGKKPETMVNGWLVAFMN